MDTKKTFAKERDSFGVWVLISEFIVGDKLKKEDVDGDVKLLESSGKHVILDLVLHNMDAMGPDYSNVLFIRDDVASSNTRAYRVDCGACWGNLPGKVIKVDRSGKPGDVVSNIEAKAKAPGRGNAYSCLKKVLDKVCKDKRKEQIQSLSKSLLKMLDDFMFKNKLFDSRFIELRRYLSES